MKILLDTAVALWFWAGSELCTERMKQTIEDPANEVLFHQASVLEIELLWAAGRLKLARPPAELLPEAIERVGFRYQPITDASIYFLERLPALPGDLIDRLLIAHAILDGCTLATVDPVLTQYAVPTLR